MAEFFERSPLAVTRNGIRRAVLCACVILGLKSAGAAQVSQAFRDCSIAVRNDTVVASNSQFMVRYLWNQGDLILLSFAGKSDPRSYVLADSVSGLKIPPAKGLPTDGRVQFRISREDHSAPAYLEASFHWKQEKLELRRVLRIYPDCPAIATDLYFKGQVADWRPENPANVNRQPIESVAATSAGNLHGTFLTRLLLPGRHWQARAVEFFDVTDRNNNLVQEYDRLLYNEELGLRGNLLFLTDNVSGSTLFLLKEAPASGSQLHYPGADFVIRTGVVKVAGPGIAPSDIREETWVKAYSFVMGFSEKRTAQGAREALRSYQECLRKRNPETDDMIIANTWGDRSRDLKVDEKFVLQELDVAARLGVTHFQLDDGWQTGRSGNSAFGGGSFAGIWRNTGYWKPDPVKFPEGFENIARRAKSHNIRLSTWFNPSTDSSFKHWEKDAEVLIDQYRKYGIYSWKIDGVNLPDKQAEVNYRRFMDKVLAATEGRALFINDLTGGIRLGYHYGAEYGMLFLENRYTDWGNYYPHFTLRNLWLLSAYLPPQRIQAEFLNKWRNQKVYQENDPFAPGRYTFDYIFATTMAATPLAWFELTGLPDEAMGTAETIRQYKKFWHELRGGRIFPIGEEPNGKSWTGFQSVLTPREGYLIVYREMNDREATDLTTLFDAGQKIRLTPVAGSGKNATVRTSRRSTIRLSLPTPGSFAVYRYEIKS